MSYRKEYGKTVLIVCTVCGWIKSYRTNTVDRRGGGWDNEDRSERPRKEKRKWRKDNARGTDTLQTDNVFTRKEYIERDAALKKLLQCADVYDPECSDITVAHAMRKISAIPAADVVPVVRCMDCKYIDKADYGGRRCDLIYHLSVTDDWFCANGEKRDGDGE